MALLVQYVCFRPFSYNAFMYTAVIPTEAQTPEFLKDCDMVNGAMLGECGDEVDAAMARVDEFMTPFMRGKQPAGTIHLPCPVQRIVTMTFMG